jgi:hypothetical protein
MASRTPVILRTYPTSPTSSLGNPTIWEAGRATSAAPTYFKAIRIPRGDTTAARYVDGGMGFNNPAEILVEEAMRVRPGRPISCIVSIGTGQMGPASLAEEGESPKIIPTDVINVLVSSVTRGEQVHHRLDERFPPGNPTTYLRFNVEQGLQDIELDDIHQLWAIISHTEAYLEQSDIKRRRDAAANLLRRNPPFCWNCKRLFDTHT